AQALETREGCGATYGVMRTQEILARVRFSQGRHEEAKTLFEQARRVREQLRAVQYPQLKRCNLSIRRRLRA
ncbi:MAG: hypothetical protein NZ821_10005, partial [Gloeomargarita sp. SKYB31]|nr:hypothetical protein [Gloeomargarita sp. SKYB31]